MSMRVRFNNPEEFLAELAAAPPNVEPVVRITRRYTQAGDSPIQWLSVVATYVRILNPDAIGHSEPAYAVVELVKVIGDLWPHGMGQTAQHQATAEALMTRLTAAAEAAGCQVRAGVYQPDEVAA